MTTAARPAEKHARRRGHAFYPPASAAAEIPAIGEAAGPLAERVAYLHYFCPVGDWYITEYDPETGDANGFAQLDHMPECAEHGGIYLPELEEILVQRLWPIERELYFKPTPLGSIDRISAHFAR